jgi:hypothetical protein
MSKFAFILLVMYCVGYAVGCAYKGTVYMNSPTGDANSITETIEADTKASLK